MNRFDFTPYRRTMVGFDRLFDLLENHSRLNSGDNYPPFNIERRGEDAYRITLAVAGFKPSDIEITAQQNLLVVQGRKPGAGSDSGSATMLPGAWKSLGRKPRPTRHPPPGATIWNAPSAPRWNAAPWSSPTVSPTAPGCIRASAGARCAGWWTGCMT